jgi:N-acetyl sugar amidotransferase
MTILYCARCLYSTDHPFGIILDEENICSGCRLHEEKFNLDWETREQSLNELFETTKARNKRSDYDCVLPIRGTPEYFFILDLLTNRYGLRVLAVNYNHQFNTNVGIRNIARMRDFFDIDFFQYTSSTVVYKKLVRESIVRLKSARWPAIAGETSMPVWAAIERNIPLIVWPFHQATEQVGAHSYLEEVEMTRMSRHSFDLLNTEPLDLVRPETLLHDIDVEDLLYPSDRLLHRSGVRGIYLANFLPWDSRANAEFATSTLGALACRNDRTFDTYDRIDDGCYMGVHDHLKFSKYGYSRVTDSLCREIRFGRVSRDVAKEIEGFYQKDAADESIVQFASWIGISDTSSLDWLIQWSGGIESFLPMSSSELGDSRPLSPQAQQFVASFHTNSQAISEDRDYRLFGKGLNLVE